MDDDEDNCECEEGAPAWLATFSDLATLLLTFFVLLLSFAQVDAEHFRDALGSIREAFGVQFVTRGRFEALSSTPISVLDMLTPPMTGQPQSQAEALRQVQAMVARSGLQDDVEVTASERGIVVRIRSQVLFPSGTDDLMPDARPVLDQVAQLANVFTRGIIIEGHTDDRPIHSARFPSNWELSGARAGRVLRYLVEEAQIDVSRLSIAGYADTHPVVPNDAPAHRAQNRRVEFIFERPHPPPAEQEQTTGARPHVQSMFLLEDLQMPRNSRILPESANRPPTADATTAAGADAATATDADADAATATDARTVVGPRAARAAARGADATAQTRDAGAE